MPSYVGSQPRCRCANHADSNPTTRVNCLTERGNPGSATVGRVSTGTGRQPSLSRFLACFGETDSGITAMPYRRLLTVDRELLNPVLRAGFRDPQEQSHAVEVAARFLELCDLSSRQLVSRVSTLLSPLPRHVNLHVCCTLNLYPILRNSNTIKNHGSQQENRRNFTVDQILRGRTCRVFAGLETVTSGAGIQTVTAISCCFY